VWVDRGAAHAANAGKPVKVQGYYNSMSKQGDKINVELTSGADLTGAKAICVVDAAKEADVAALAQKSQVTVDGTLSADKAGDAEKIDGCSIEPGAAPPADGKDGKAGKAGKAGDEGKAGKAGKAKAP